MVDLLKFALCLRGRHHDDAVEALDHVRAAETAREARTAAALDVAPREMRAIEQTRQPKVCFGTALSVRNESFRVLLPEREAWAGGHWAITGATGCGKSFLALAALAQRLRKGRGGCVIIDMKGELAKLVREALLPSIVAALAERDPDAARALVSRIAVLAPFDPTATPPFQVLARDPSLTIQEQAHEVASSFGRTIGRDLGPLQETVLRYALQLAINTGHTLPDVTRILSDEDFRRSALERCSLPDVRQYYATRFPRERAGSVGALLSRLDSLSMYPGLRRMLSARGMVRMSKLIEDAITIIDLGGSPAGMRDIPQFLGQLFFQKLVRAIFARRVRTNDRTPPVTIMADEFQELLSPEVARDFERVLTLARSQKCFIWMLFQQAAQLEATSPTLLRLVRTNTNYQCVFRANPEDARAFSHILPATGTRVRERQGFPDPRVQGQPITAEEERRELLDLVPRMPDRLFWFWDRRRPYPALLVRSPTLDLGAMRRRAEALPRELREVISRGVVALDPPAPEPEGRPPRDAAARLRVVGEENAAPREPAGDEPTATSPPAPAADPAGDQEHVPERARRRRRPRGVPLG